MAHVNAYSSFVGVTRILTPDNLKTGVIKNTRSELVLNKSYQELAEHYGTAIIPARVRSPKDKSTVEGTVGSISSFILAAIRNQTFLSLKELNEVFYDGSRIYSHVRLHGRRGQYSTAEEHMPPQHQQYIQWNGERFRKWASQIGTNTATVVDTILTGCKVEQQGYRACMALLKLSEQYTSERLEAACAKALFYTPGPGYKAIQAIQKSGQDKKTDERPQTSSQYGFTRGTDYYKGGHDGC